MSWLSAAIIVVIAGGIFNAWVIRPSRPTPYRPDGADNIVEEFEEYGLPGWVAYPVGAAKLGLAATLVAGIFYKPLIVPAAVGMAGLMAVAVGAHFKVNDPLRRAAPAISLLALSVATIVLAVVDVGA